MKKKAGEAKGEGRRRGVKVVYIASPMKVKTCASRFRALVQELTGRESDVARYMEMQVRREDGGDGRGGGDHSINSELVMAAAAGTVAVDHRHHRYSASTSTSTSTFDDMDAFLAREDDDSMIFPTTTFLSHQLQFPPFDHGIINYGV